MIAGRLDPSDSSRLPGAETDSVVTGSAPFSVLADQPEPDVVVVSVVGEIDMLTAPTLQDHLNRWLAAGSPRLIIDLTDTSLLGATALSVLSDVRRAAANQGTRLQLRPPKRTVPARALSISGLDRLCEIASPITDSDGSPKHHPARHAEVPCPRAAHRADAAASATSVVESGQDEYERLIPLQRRYARLTADDPQRFRLRHQLIQGYLPVAEHIARRFVGRGEPLDDLIQIATVGLINAIDRFEPARGSHFLAFAVPTITGELRRYFRDHGWSTHVPRPLKDLTLAIRKAAAELSQQLGCSPRPSQIAAQLGVPTSRVIEALQAAEAYRSSSLDDLLSRECSPATDQAYLGESDPQMCLIDNRETLRPLLAQLTPRQRTILTLRFIHEFTQKQIAKQIGVSQMQVSRLLRQILDFLHQHMADSEKPHWATNVTKHPCR